MHYVKVHATWEVLTRYAEIMQLRLPMREVPEDNNAQNFLDRVKYDLYNWLTRPFKLDESLVPVIPKKFTCIFQRDKEYL